MTKQQLDKLISTGFFPEKDGQPQLIETHISWVILQGSFVYKIKKPIQYSFIDFSTLAKREFYCHREILLNQRLTNDIYIDVQPIIDSGKSISIGEATGEIIDFAVKMNKVDGDRQMDVLLSKNQVTVDDVKNLARKIARFHSTTEIIHKKNCLEIKNEFNDLEKEADFLCNNLGQKSADIIYDSINKAGLFIDEHQALLCSRLQAGCYRDCHGDLHSRNIFLLLSPQPFDCIEFNDDLRQIDVLNEVAFLCMDLDSFGREDLAAIFLEEYNQLFPTLVTGEDSRLLIYYKAYRANIRAKINGLRARTATNTADKAKAISEANKYLQLLERYIGLLN